ncbi:MAG: hypothetical protein ABR949_06005 [Candidatus Aquilonibacter sp.]|jgi:hypothetical protein
MSKLGATTLIAIGALAMVIGAPGVYLALYAYASVDALNDGSFLLTVGGIAIAAAAGIFAAYNGGPNQRFPAWVLSLVIIVASLLGIGYGTVNRLQLERDRISAVHAQDALRRDNAALVVENARVKKTAEETYAAALKLDRTSAQTLLAIQRQTATAGLINQRTLDTAAQAASLQSSASAVLLRLEQLTISATKKKPNRP